jgi:hypothetical protein
MSNKLTFRILGTIAAGAFAGSLALASPALARGGHGMGGGGGHWGGGGMHHAAMGPHWSGGGWQHAHVSHFAFRHHHHFRRFAVFGAPYYYASYDDCWRRVWTAYGPRLINVCGDGY